MREILFRAKAINRIPDREYIDANALKRKFIEGDGHDDDRFTEGFNFATQVYREYIDDAVKAACEAIQVAAM